MPTPGGQSKLEIEAIQDRIILEVLNIFKGDDPNNGYSATHTNAISDSQTPERGRGNGTGDSLDVNNYSIGTKTDIEGNPEIPGSGRIPAIANNGSTWGYTPDNWYEKPNTDGNVGQYQTP